MNCYRVLGIESDADLDQIKKAFREATKKYHPDVSGGDTVNEFKQIMEAYDLLIDPQRKAVHDLRYARKSKRRGKRKTGLPLDHGRLKISSYNPAVDLWGDPINQIKEEDWKDTYGGSYDEADGMPDLR